MAQIIGLPKLSPTMEEGVLVRWTKKEGDKVSPGDLVAEVETDKANMDFNIEDEGVLLKLLVKEGETVQASARRSRSSARRARTSSALGRGGARWQARARGAQPPRGRSGARAEGEKAAATGSAAAPPRAPARGPARLPPRRRRASPRRPAPARRRRPRPRPASCSRRRSRRRLAIELGIDLRSVEGSGPGGRIVERDVRAAAARRGRRRSVEHARRSRGAPPEDRRGHAPRSAVRSAIAVRQPRAEDLEGDYDGHPRVEHAQADRAAPHRGQARRPALLPAAADRRRRRSWGSAAG